MRKVADCYSGTWLSTIPQQEHKGGLLKVLCRDVSCQALTVAARPSLISDPPPQNSYPMMRSPKRSLASSHVKAHFRVMAQFTYEH